MRTNTQRITDFIFNIQTDTPENRRILNLYFKARYEIIEIINLSSLSEEEVNNNSKLNPITIDIELSPLFSLNSEKKNLIGESSILSYLRFIDIFDFFIFKDADLFDSVSSSAAGFHNLDFKTMFNKSNDLKWLKRYLYANPKYAVFWKLDSESIEIFSRLLVQKRILENAFLNNFRKDIVCSYNPTDDHEKYLIPEDYYDQIFKTSEFDTIFSHLAGVTVSVNSLKKSAKSEILDELNDFLNNELKIRLDQQLEYSYADKTLKMPDDEVIYSPITEKTFKFVNELYKIRHDKNEKMTVTEALNKNLNPSQHSKYNLNDHILTGSKSSSSLYDKYIEPVGPRHYRFKVK